jgi:23S rRNA pseudouridine1911/1915/1917 synthase
MNETVYFRAETWARRFRLEDYLLEKMPDISKMYLRELIKTGKCQVNGEFENRGYRLRENDFIELEIDRRVEPAMTPENIPLEIVFEDAEIIVVNKPPEMLMHPTFAQKTGTILNALAFYLNFSSQNQPNAVQEKTDCKPFSADEINFQSASARRRSFVRPGLIHRLDRQTSGLVVAAKTPRAHRILSDHFKRKLVEKKYLALVEGVVRENSGTIIAPIGRSEELKLWNVKEDGKYSETRFWVKERFAERTLLELEPVTGRTNQLRIHCAHIGHPIVGDQWHAKREFSRLCLHAFRLSFWHPAGNRRLEFETGR